MRAEFGGNSKASSLRLRSLNASPHVACDRSGFQFRLGRDLMNAMAKRCERARPARLRLGRDLMNAMAVTQPLDLSRLLRLGRDLMNAMAHH